MPANYDAKSLPPSLKEGYQRFLKKVYPKNQELFSTLAEQGQSPRILWIGCVDSRVTPENILGADPGDLLILRNVANMVPPYEAEEASVGSAVHFAVEALDVDHIIVCGHSDCGGVKALSNLGKGPMDRMLSSWVEYGISALEENDGDDLESLIKTNVVVQSNRLMEYPSVSGALKDGKVAIHAFYYDIGTGGLQHYDKENSVWSDFS